MLGGSGGSGLGGGQGGGANSGGGFTGAAVPSLQRPRSGNGGGGLHRGPVAVAASRRVGAVTAASRRLGAATAASQGPGGGGDLTGAEAPSSQGPRSSSSSGGLTPAAGQFFLFFLFSENGKFCQLEQANERYISFIYILLLARDR
jgi:hypothetical protein